MDCLVLKHVVHLVANVGPLVVFWVILKLLDRNHLALRIVGDINIEVLFVLSLEKRIGHDNANFVVHPKQGTGK